MDAQTKIGVAGATGRVGRHVVDVVTERGYEVVAMSRANRVDLISGDGLAEALSGVMCVIDVATYPLPDQKAATEFFTTAARNLHETGRRAGVERLVVVSIIGVDAFSGGYSAAKLAHERAALSGPIPARILRAAQFHEFVDQMLEWSTQGDVAYVPSMRTQTVAAHSVAEALVDLATETPWEPHSADGPFPEIAGPQEERLAELAGLLVAHRGQALRIEEVENPDDPDAKLFSSGALLPGPGAKLVGPTFREWLTAD
jgi:uncharacterized protein YbjT (DUF2867 family)